MSQVGVCCFDDPSLAGEGWACVAGGEARRVNGYAGLSPDVLWVTNLSYKQHSDLNLRKTPYIFDCQYFRTPLYVLMAELGLSDNPEEAVTVLSEVFTRMHNLAVTQFGIPEGERGYRFTSMLASLLTPRAHRRKPSTPYAADLESAINQSVQYNQVSFGGKAPSNTRVVGFVFPRGSYGRWVLSQPMPSATNWKKFEARDASSEFGTENGKVLSGTKSTLQRLNQLGQKHAGFLKVSVVSMDEFYAQFAQFGNGSQKPRGWATIPEIIEMARYSRLKLSHGYLCDLETLPLYEKAEIDSGEYSLSRSLLIENLWAGLSMPIHGSPRSTALAAYLRAYDRIALGRVAEEFERQNISVGSYSTGRLVAYVRDGEGRAAYDLAMRCGMLPPMDMVG